MYMKGHDTVPLSASAIGTLLFTVFFLGLDYTFVNTSFISFWHLNLLLYKQVSSAALFLPLSDLIMLWNFETFGLNFNLAFFCHLFHSVFVLVSLSSHIIIVSIMQESIPSTFLV